MLKKKPNRGIDNSGANDGIIAGEIHGDVDNRRTYYINVPNNKKLPSIITKVVEALAQLAIMSEEEIDIRYKVDAKDLRAYKIPEKITQNHVVKHKATILEYSHYGRMCDEAFNIVDNNLMGSKSKVLRDIQQLYRDCKGQLLLENDCDSGDEMEIIRKHSDSIIEMVRDELKERILNDDSESFFYEDLNDGLIRVVCYAFIECKILEKPQVCL